MSWLNNRLTTLHAALGYRRYLLVPLIGAIAAFVDWVVTRLAEAGMSNLIGVPSWAIGAFFATIMVGWWILEYAVKLRNQLLPKLEVLFDPESGGLTSTSFTNLETGEFVDTVKYIRISVKGVSQKTVRECVANLVKIERRLDLARTETIWDQDALPLQWSITGGLETNVHHLTNRYVDVACVPKKSGRLEILTPIPNRLAPELEKTGTFLITVVVTGDEISSDATIEIETDGTFHGVKARAI